MEHAEEPASGLAHGKEDQHNRPGSPEEAVGASRRATRARADAGSREAADAQAVSEYAGDGSAVRRTARHSERSQGGTRRCVRTDDAGS